VVVVRLTPRVDSTGQLRLTESANAQQHGAHQTASLQPEPSPRILLLRDYPVKSKTQSSIRRLIRETGRIPVERDTLYRPVARWSAIRTPLE
jgi:hypothetical protein